MSISELSIRKPVLATVISILLVIFGAVGFSFLGTREYPAVDPPIITVTTSYPGANPDVIESQITEPLEQAINGIAGVRFISSTSREQVSVISVEFNIDVDLEAAANDVRSKVSQAIRNLPQDADPPVVEKADANSQSVVFLSVQSDTRSLLELSDYANNVIKERMQTIPGVSGAYIRGERRYSMRLWMDPVRMSAYKIIPADIQAALRRENIDLPTGRLEGNETEITLRTDSRLVTPEEYNRMIIKTENGRIVRFSDVGYAELGIENERSSIQRSTIPGVLISIQPQPNANEIAIADEVYKRLEELKAEVPEDIRLEIANDYTKPVRRSIKEVEETLIIAFLLVVIVIFLFLRDWRSTLIPVIAIPISIIATFFIMYIAGFSINVLTLVAIVLAIGLVCDDAIVVLENIYAKVEKGMSPFQAALVGSKEIYFAVISTTVTLASIFIPIIFLQGLTGRLFLEFGVVMAGSVLISALVALTLSPMMCAYLLKHQDKPSRFYRTTEQFYEALTKGYNRSLQAFMRIRWSAVVILLLMFVVIGIIGTRIQSELAPLEDRGIIRVNVKAPEGVSYEYMERYMKEIDQYINDSVPELFTSVALTAVIPGGGTFSPVNAGLENVFLVDPDQRERTQDQIFQQLSKGLENFTGVRTFPAQPPTIGSRFGGQPVQFVIQAPDLQSLLKSLPVFLEEAQQHPTLRFVDSDLKVNKPELVLRINREKASELNVSVEEIARTLQLSYSGQRYGYFLMNGKQYQVIGQMQRNDRNEPLDLKSIYIRNQNGDMVSLDNLITYDETVSAAAIYRYNRYISATVSAGLAEGKTLGEGIAAMNEVAAKILPPTFKTDLAGQSKEYADSSSSLFFAFILALVLIYLILAAQFESFIDPFIILLTVPTSIAGALFTLYLFGQTLNIFSQIGIIMLIGLVTKNGILIVEFANQRKLAGLSRIDAVLEAATTRFRPILMTSLATILGILPIALSLGTAAGSRQSLGIAVVGGMIISGFLTLYIVPAMYSYLSRSRKSLGIATEKELAV
ncbi:efflux RND transporter permease subunit [Rhodocytophaga rosea]|uniref:Efflux RND transporter permease subunit n=1 Tax=Rhodocytophaga rosea TaxID=2704465 RepID=A0A6C0GFU3_9BACT|nr:efflux RND transporter permease subunit [Rhodocytophaga rosea]QHT66858.1 efflux RND transporter permease subunit [Rhodocytophaga rosea]